MLIIGIPKYCEAYSLVEAGYYDDHGHINLILMDFWLYED